MPDGHDGIVADHSGTAKTHDPLNLFSFNFTVAVGGAVIAKALVLAVAAMVQPV